MQFLIQAQSGGGGLPALLGGVLPAARIVVFKRTRATYPPLIQWGVSGIVRLLNGSIATRALGDPLGPHWDENG